jgi:hypothetical protein
MLGLFIGGLKGVGVRRGGVGRFVVLVIEMM